MIPCIRNSGKFKITVRESRLGIARRWEEVGRGGEAQEYLGGDRNVLYLECGRGYTTANIWQNSLSDAPSKDEFHFI